MKQVAQSYAEGKPRVEEVPMPQLRPGGALVQTAYSLISAGTERHKAEAGGKSLLGKALARPDQVRKVIDTARAQGIQATWRRVRRELDALRPLGYSASGMIAALGDGAEGLRVGERVAIGGGGWANHAEVNWVPRRLVVPVPYGVDLADAAYACVGSVAMHGVRQADMRLGESALVLGLGLVGQLTVQLLAASGVRVFGVDLDESRCALAMKCGAAAAMPRSSEGLEEAVKRMTGGLGLDAALLCADTASDDPVALSTRLVRDRGRVVVVGAVGLALDRAAFFAKEIDLRFSRSYGPGRYDPHYEEEGRDYPAGYVRWTEERNMASFLELVAAGKLKPSMLTTHRYPLAAAEDAYDILLDRGAKAMGVLLEYEAGADHAPQRDIDADDVKGARADASDERAVVVARAGMAEPPPPAVGVGWIGPGKFAQAMLLPNVPKALARMAVCASGSGLEAPKMLRKWRFERAVGDNDAVIHDPDVDLVMITTRHDLHASLAMEALRAGKAVFVEKPLCLSTKELEEIAKLLAAHRPRLRHGARYADAPSGGDGVDTPPPGGGRGASGPRGGGALMVGYNRRFAPATKAALEFLAREAPGAERAITINIHAGPLPGDSWIHRSEGGGRILGEMCHFIDLAMCLAGSPAATVHARPLASKRWENVAATIQHANGSVSQVLYLAIGSPKLPKERIEISADKATVAIEDFATTELMVGTKSRREKHGVGDKGHQREMEALFDAVARGLPMPLSPAEALHSSAATFAVIESLKSGEPVELE